MFSFGAFFRRTARIAALILVTNISCVTRFDISTRAFVRTGIAGKTFRTIAIVVTTGGAHFCCRIAVLPRAARATAGCAIRFALIRVAHRTTSRALSLVAAGACVVIAYVTSGTVSVRATFARCKNNDHRNDGDNHRTANGKPNPGRYLGSRNLFDSEFHTWAVFEVVGHVSLFHAQSYGEFSPCWSSEAQR